MLNRRVPGIGQRSGGTRSVLGWVAAAPGAIKAALRCRLGAKCRCCNCSVHLAEVLLCYEAKVILQFQGIGEDSEFVRNDAEGGEPPFLRKGWKKQPLPEKVRMLSRLRHWCYVEHRSEPSVPVPPTTGSLTEEEINQELESLHKLAFKIANPPKAPANKNPSTELAKQVAKYCFVCGSGPLDAPALQRHVRKHAASVA